MENVSSGNFPFDYDDNERNFKKVFEVLSKSHGERIFGRLGAEDKLQSNFNIYHFESITIGIQPVIDNDNAVIAKIRDGILSLKKDEVFKAQTTGGGKNSPGPLKSRIDVAPKYLEEALK